MPILQAGCMYTGWRDFGFVTRTARESATGVDTGADESARKSSTLKSSKTLVDGSGAAKDSVDVSAAAPLTEFVTAPLAGACGVTGCEDGKVSRASCGIFLAGIYSFDAAIARFSRVRRSPRWLEGFSDGIAGFRRTTFVTSRGHALRAARCAIHAGCTKWDMSASVSDGICAPLA